MTRRLPATDRFDTHDVMNQPDFGEREGLWAGDAILRHLTRQFAAEAGPLAAFAEDLAAPSVREAARAAQRHAPELHQYDRSGRRVDEVHFHPGYHDLLRIGLESGYAAGPWTGGSHVTHAAQVYLLSQVEPGVCCPLTMTYAAVPALEHAPDLDQVWRPRLLSRRYDPAVAPISAKSGATLGMAMTEKQGGSDVRANATRAVRDGAGYRLTGHKWFCSAPMSDGFLTLAQTEEGLTCFLVPRWLEEGRNAIRLMRLKDKLGNRANASAEIEYDAAFAHRVGAEGRGLQAILKMVHHTRLDTAMAPAGLMRAALAEALFWCRNRTAFQRRLIDQPLMQTVLADLVLDACGALALGLRVAQAFGRPEEAAFARLSVALAKYLANKRCPVVIVEAMECLGGMGYVEETPLPMLYREAPLNGIWEGSGNVICLDVLRTAAKEPAAFDALDAELAEVANSEPAFARHLRAFRQAWPGLPDEAQARRYVEELATLLTSAVLLRHLPGPIADAYAATRLGDHGRGLTPGSVALDPAGILAAYAPH